MKKKRLYWNSCSFLDNISIIDNISPLSNVFDNSKYGSYKASIGGGSNEAIFRRTLIDISKNNFDFALIAWSHPERFFITDVYNNLDYNKLKEDGDRQFFATKWNESMYGYVNQIPYHSKNGAEILKLEPKGTDDTIIYTLSLHNFFKQKGIPHLFLNMGKLDSKVIWARESWLDGIDSKNYLSLNDSDTMMEKMQFSFVEHFLELDEKSLIKDEEIKKLNDLGKLNKSDNKKIYTCDDSGHLSELSYQTISEYFYHYIIKNNLV